MEELATVLGKNIIRKLYYDIKVKKQSLRDNGEDMGDYPYQAIQQREIAVEALFDDAILRSGSEDINKNENTKDYYDYLAKNHKQFMSFDDNGNSWEDYLTVEGLQHILKIYKDILISKQAAWHDGIFENIPNTEQIDEIEPCTVNYNFLERQQGIRISAKSLKIPRQFLLNVEDAVHDSIYTLDVDEYGANTYVELASVDEQENK